MLNVTHYNEAAKLVANEISIVEKYSILYGIPGKYTGRSSTAHCSHVQANFLLLERCRWFCEK